MKPNTSAIALLAVVLLLATATGSVAHDFWDNWAGKPWQRGEPGTTYQLWEFSESPGPQPIIVHNPYGVPQLTVQIGQYPDVVDGPDGQPIPTWHLGEIVVGADGTIQEIPGTFDVFIPNNPEPNALKLIYVQITSDKGTSQPPNVFPVPSSISSPGPIIKHGPTSWYTYNWLIEIRPNPPYERVQFVFPYSTNISQIVVDTICTVPEPSSLAALGMSALFAGTPALRRRRR